MAVEIRTGSETGPIVQTVTLKSTGTNSNTFTDQTFDLNFSGSQRLFFVFRAIAATGAPANNFGNLNWIEFSGRGVGIDPAFFPRVPGDVGGTVPATLSLTLGTAGLVRRVHAGRRARLHRVDRGDGDLDRG